MPITSRRIANAADLLGSGRLDPAWPVHATASADTAASAPEVWAALSAIDRWPSFVPGVTKARLDGAAITGVTFTWTNDGTPLRSTVQVAEPGRELSWTGTALWIVAAHRNVIEPLPGGGCRLTSAEGMSGVGVRLMMPPAKLTLALQAFVDAVVAEAERRSSR